MQTVAKTVILHSASLAWRSLGHCWISRVCLHVSVSLINVSWIDWERHEILKLLHSTSSGKSEPTLFHHQPGNSRRPADWAEPLISGYTSWAPPPPPQQAGAGTAPLSSSGLLARLMVVRPELELWFRAAASFCAKSLQEETRETLLTVSVTLCFKNYLLAYFAEVTLYPPFVAAEKVTFWHIFYLRSIAFWDSVMATTHNKWLVNITAR